MWRYLVGAGAALALGLGGILLFRGAAAPGATKAVAPSPPAAISNGEPGEAMPDSAPEAGARTREQKRFDRYDKDRNEAITREEYLASRRKAFARLDGNGDGRLSFEEWAAKTIGKFTGADADKSGALTRAEFATTAPKKRKARPRCVGVPAPGEAASAKAEED